MATVNRDQVFKRIEKTKKSESLDAVIKELENYSTLVETMEKFPDYLFGNISLAEYYLSKEESRKIPGLLDNKLEITQHYPEETET